MLQFFFVSQVAVMLIFCLFLLPATSFGSWPLIIWYYWHSSVVFSALNNVLERNATFYIMPHIFTTAVISARVVFVRERWQRHKGLQFLILKFSSLRYKVITIFIIFLFICCRRFILHCHQDHIHWMFVCFVTARVHQMSFADLLHERTELWPLIIWFSGCHLTYDFTND